MNGEGRKERKERKDGRTRWERGVVVESMILLGRVCLVLVSSQSLILYASSQFFYDGCVYARKARGKSNNFFYARYFEGEILEGVCRIIFCFLTSFFFSLSLFSFFPGLSVWDKSHVRGVGNGFCTTRDPFGLCLFGSCFFREPPFFQSGHFFNHGFVRKEREVKNQNNFFLILFFSSHPYVPHPLMTMEVT